jgi:hypothetical protein
MVVFLFAAISLAGLQAQTMRQFTRFSLPKNPSITRYDTLRVGNAFSLDKNISVGVIYHPSWIYMCLGVFNNARKDAVSAAFDSLNWTDIPDRLYFYKTTDPGDGILVIWQVSYVFYAETRAYLYQHGSFRKIGNIAIDLDCPGCPDIKYPVEAIRIFTSGHKVMFTFTRDLVLRISKPVNAKDFFFLYEDGVLRPVIQP